MTKDAVEAIHLRNSFYRDGHRLIRMLLLLCIAIICALSGGLIYVITHPPEPKYFATTVDGRIMPLIALGQPNLSKAALLQWANTAAIAVYNYDFVNYRQQLQDASQYFTADGWTTFMNALQSTNILSSVQQQKLIVSAVATGSPVVLAEGLLDGRYSWKVQMPMLVTYQSASQFSQQSVVVTMIIVRVSTLSTPRGIEISQFVVGPAGTGGGNDLSNIAS